MRREAFLAKRAEFQAAVRRRRGWCLVFPAVSVLLGLLVGATVFGACLIYLGLLGCCLADGFFCLHHLQKRLALECPRCHRMLVTATTQEHVLETGRCPSCREGVLEPEGETGQAGKSISSA